MSKKTKLHIIALCIAIIAYALCLYFYDWKLILILFILQWASNITIIAEKKEPIELKINNDNEQVPYWLFNIVEISGEYRKVMIEIEDEEKAKKDVKLLHPGCAIASSKFYND